MKQLLLSVFLASAGLPAGAASVTNIFVTNLSDADYAFQGAGTQAEFRTANGGTSAVAVNGSVSSFTNRFAWLLAGRAQGYLDGSLVASGNVSYELGFTVEDPLSAGYIIQVSAFTRGWLTAKWEGGLNAFGQTGAAGTGFDVEVSRNGQYAAAPLLEAFGSASTADAGFDFVNDLVISGGSAISAIQSGTNQFTLRFNGRPTVVGAGLETDGEGAVRFGLLPTLPGFQYAATPGDDGEPAEDLGHFVTIQVIGFDPQPAPVPEPGTAALLLAGLALACAGRRSMLTRHR